MDSDEEGGEPNQVAHANFTFSRHSQGNGQPNNVGQPPRPKEPQNGPVPISAPVDPIAQMKTIVPAETEKCLNSMKELLAKQGPTISGNNKAANQNSQTQNGNHNNPHSRWGQGRWNASGQVQCYNCQGYGHMAKEGPNPELPQGGGQQAPAPSMQGLNAYAQGFVPVQYPVSVPQSAVPQQGPQYVQSNMAPIQQTRLPTVPVSSSWTRHDTHCPSSTATIKLMGVVPRGQGTTQNDVIEQEVIVHAYLDREEHVNVEEERPLLVEMHPSLPEGYGCLLAPTVVEVANTTTIPVHIFNPQSNPIVIRQDSVVWQVETVKVQQTIAKHENPNEVWNNSAARRVTLQETGGLKGKTHMSRCQTKFHRKSIARKTTIQAPTVPLPEHLKGLYEESIRGKSKGQYAQVHSLLQKHENVFSKDKYDLGHAHLVEHTIDTGNAKPIKQPPT